MHFHLLKKDALAASPESGSKKRLRILFVNSIQMFAGGEVWMLNTLHGLGQRGHAVFLLCRPGTELEQRARSQGIPVFTLRFRGDFDPFTILQIFHLLRNLKVDVILTNMDKELRLAGVASKLAGIKAIIPRRGIDYPLKPHLGYQFSYRLLADRIIANSQATKLALLRHAPWLRPEKIQVIYNGIKIEDYVTPPQKNLRSELGISESDFLMGFVGQLDERKGVFTLLQAFQQLNQSFPRTFLLLAGHGALQPRIEQFVREQFLQERVFLLGFRDDVPEIMKAIDVLVLPSLWEGFGLVLVEAMAAGKPVIATNVSNLPEIVEDGKVGYLVPPQDSQQLAQALQRLIECPDAVHVMGQRAQQHVREYFTIDRMLDEIENLFYQVVTAKSTGVNRIGGAD